ncbi:MAG: hypothetical protein ACK4ND_15735 [Cytophagaceae bacterium]
MMNRPLFFLLKVSVFFLVFAACKKEQETNPPKLDTESGYFKGTYKGEDFAYVHGKDNYKLTHTSVTWQYPNDHDNYRIVYNCFLKNREDPTLPNFYLEYSNSKLYMPTEDDKDVFLNNFIPGTFVEGFDSEGNDRYAVYYYGEEGLCFMENFSIEITYVGDLGIIERENSNGDKVKKRAVRLLGKIAKAYLRPGFTLIYEPGTNIEPNLTDVRFSVILTSHSEYE